MPAQPSIRAYFAKPHAAATARVALKSTSPPTARQGTENMPVNESSEAGRVIAKESKKRTRSGETAAAAASTTKVAKVTASATSTIPSKTAASGKFDSVADVREAVRGTSLPLLELETKSMGEDWFLALQQEFTKPYFLKLKEFVTTEQRTKKVFPPGMSRDEYTRQDIYSWSTLCPLKDVRVVIIGQDPYHDDGQAHGLAFSVRQGVKIPPSLRNIYKEMTNEIPGWVSPTHGDLTEWAKHGVLLLNTSLTVRAHTAGSHSKAGWDQFTAAVLKVVTDRLAPTSGEGSGANGVVFMAWGAHAAKMCAGVDSKKHLILKSAHPSPLSASRGYFGNNHFNLANEWLEERYGAGGGIDWKALGAAPPV
ncbi:uracil-DNA glycosylase [Cryptococcus wingfieldii CBS 7118]|uniref:Uracil-DNA glycosylase n=1 Tax=Cryptococcus wingfieldii CBS 7118 TaxID=1295528 RepID=A0A1E3JH43_9TREE|nr:uracil-DNA glycosylase [Cryptococcus wingfieldii CBS 7118]ODN99426.1 uracil-DNA glycosylase [Cryptococcus wingfieldii CBS 7118]